MHTEKQTPIVVENTLRLILQQLLLLPGVARLVDVQVRASTKCRSCDREQIQEQHGTGSSCSPALIALLFQLAAH